MLVNKSAEFGMFICTEIRHFSQLISTQSCGSPVSLSVIHKHMSVRGNFFNTCFSVVIV